MKRIGARSCAGGGPLRVVLLLAFALVLASAAEAYAATVTWTLAQPADGAVLSNPSLNISIRASAPASGPWPLAQTARLWVDGVQELRGNPGMFTTPATGSYVSGTDRYVLIRRSPPFVVRDGSHSLAASIADVNGVVSSYPVAPATWSFTVSAPPRASLQSPSGVVGVARPALGLTLTDNDPGMLEVSVTLRRDSASGPVVQTFAGSYPQGVLSFVPAADLGEGIYYVTATFRNPSPGVNNSQITTLPWSFTVDAYPPMSLAAIDCANCHSTPHINVNCDAACHDALGYGGMGTNEYPMIEDHGNTCIAICHSPTRYPAYAYHSPAIEDVRHASSCNGCHTTPMTALHGQYPVDSPFKYQCALCHESTDPGVAGAVAVGVATPGPTECSACHATPDHRTLHDYSLREDCRDCHSSNISEEHQDACTICHDNVDPDVISAIGGHKIACAACHDPGYHPAGFFGIKTDYYQWTTTPGPRDSGSALGTLATNPTNPGAHANYLATTAKCGMCHSVHRATASGTKLLPTNDATCSGCHLGSTAVTAKIVTVAPVNTNWVPGDLNGPAGGAGGPHNDSAADLVADGYWDGTGATPQPSYAHGQRYGCWTRRCHATNPHGANASKYKIFAAKLLFNDTPAQDAAAFSADPGWDPLLNTYGGDDAVWDAVGATDAAVERFVAQNATIMSTNAAGDIFINGVAPDAAETHALVSGLTCGRPSNPGGYDECHAEASYAIVDKGIVESRNHATGITSPSTYRTDNTGEEDLGFGGNDNRDLKTGHVAGSFDATATHASYAPIAGCTSCHDQTDAANTVAGHFTFPHGQTPTGATNLVQADGVTSATGLRARLWSGYAGSTIDALVYTAGTNQKAYDGQCLKCHRDGAGNGIGITH